ncbi:MAG: hypothetical protein ACP5J4_11300 [Anaerolineae bacterium]
MPTALEHEIARFTQALRRHGLVVGAGWGVVVALAALLAAAVAARITPLWHQAELLLASIWAVGGGIIVGAALGYIWPTPLPRRLRLFDRRLHLADRLTTAWELAQGHIAAPITLTHLQQTETLTATRSIDPQPVFPLRPPRAAGFAVLVLLPALALTLFLTNPQENALIQREAQQQAAATAIAQLEAVQETLAANDTLSEAERAAALKALEEALAALRDRRSTPAQQQAALSAAERQLAELRSPEAAAQLQRLAEASPLSTADVVQPLAEALQRGDAEAAAAYLRDLVDPTDKQPLTAEETLALADAFQQMADTLYTTDQELAEQLDAAAQEIYNGDMTAARTAVQEAAETLSAAAQANAPNQTLEQAQAAVQQAQEGLGATQRQTTADTPSESAVTQPGASGIQGKPGTGTQGQTADGAAGVPGGGNNTHSEDSGSGQPYGSAEAPRIAGQGSEITLPRQETLGPPRTTTGLPGEARIPYQDVYAPYAEAAQADLSRSVYPPALRAYVREYFNGLEP